MRTNTDLSETKPVRPASFRASVEGRGDEFAGIVENLPMIGGAFPRTAEDACLPICPLVPVGQAETFGRV